ncbi:MAG: ubiquinone/menaquinone biosynthesis methyltransferase [Opitutales bacterium]
MKNNNYKERDPEKVKAMFSKIAPSYDRANRLMCFGLDQYWRKVLAKLATKDAQEGDVFLDAACGSGDVSLKILEQAKGKKLIGVDFCQELLEIAKIKCCNYENASFELADCSNLAQFKDNTFKAITISFGFRNFQDREKCLSEFHRILKDKGQLLILEVARPEKFGAKIISFFMNKICPILAKIAGSNMQDYVYLAKTAQLFPKESEFKEMLENAKFTNYKRINFLTSLNSVSITKVEK